ncbi:ATP-binding protein, partial [Cryptosporangium minutisporangium]|uniref:ATP-binding protein n=1 Tax=Cryptosporangium minutisporangium TaxID=113569 RepID=UPI0035EA490E
MTTELLPDPADGLLGRGRELDRLRRCVDAGRHGPSTLIVSGAPGSGRTRLLAAAVRMALRAGPRRVLAVFDPSGPVRLARSLTSEIDLLPDAQCAAARGGDPAALAAALIRAARSTPVLLTVDDAERSSPQTRDLLDRLVRGAPGVPITVLLTAGVDGLPAW